MYKRSLGYFAGALLLAACQGNEQAPLYQNIFEEPSEGVTLTAEQAHSWTHAAVIEPDQEFALSFTKKLGEWGTPREIRVSAWAMLPSGKVTATMLVDLNRPGESGAIYSKHISLNQVARRYNRWVQVHSRIVFPRNRQPDDVVKVFFWNRTKNGRILIDDLMIEKIR